ncbi:MAG: hypothetical protein KC486_28670 [Myxococcales bacterium]|nr:hypothetical protein [Myxococcales bacterium]
MEALLVVVAEVAAVQVLAGGLVAAASLLGAAVGLITALTGLRLPTQPRLRRLRRALALALVVAATAVVALQTVALRPTLGWLLAGLGEARGYTVEIGAAELSLLRGGLALGDLRVRKGDGVDLHVDHLELDLDWSSIAGARLELQDLEVRGVLGRYAPAADAERRPPSRRRRPQRPPTHSRSVRGCCRRCRPRGPASRGCSPRPEHGCPEASSPSPSPSHPRRS